MAVGPMDPLVLGVVAAVLAVVAFAACTLPARRASRIDPIIALSDRQWILLSRTLQNLN